MTKMKKSNATVNEQVAKQMDRNKRRCLSIAKRLREQAADLIAEAERNETKSDGYGRVATTLKGSK